MKKCPICDKPMMATQRKTRWETMGKTEYYRCNKCKAVFAFPEKSVIPIKLKGGEK